jgi:DNA-binding response OmpR family regulator
MMARRRRILLVDVDDGVRQLLRTTLSAAGHDVIEASNADDGLRLATDELPALVLLEWQMPGRHGSLVLDELKHVRPALPVIVLTTEARQSEREFAESLGADAFVDKPVHPDEVLAQVERLLARAV